MASILKTDGTSIHRGSVEQRRTKLVVTNMAASECQLTWGNVTLARGPVGVPLEVDLRQIPLGTAMITARAAGITPDTKTTTVIPSKGYVSPAPLGPDGTARTCTIPRDELIVTPGADAVSISDWTGRLFKGKVMTPVAGLNSRDFVVEADGRTEALLTRNPNGGPVNISHASISGMERDIDGEPVALHEVNRLVYQGAMTLSHCEISWGNDCWGMGTNGKLLDSYTHSHTVYLTSEGVEQHRDSVQMQQGGGQTVVGTIHDLRNNPVPTRKDGGSVRVATTTKAASSAFMINHDKPIIGLVTFVDNITYGGSSVVLNVSGGIPDGDTVEWWVIRRDEAGNPVRGLIVDRNIIEEMTRDGLVVRARKEWMRENFGSLWYDAPAPSTLFQVRNSDGTLDNTLSDVALLGT